MSGNSSRQQPRQDPATGGLVVETEHEEEQFQEGLGEARSVGYEGDPPASIAGAASTPAEAEHHRQPRTFTEEEVAKIRREEKDKLYGEIESTKERLERLEAERQAERDAVAQQQAEAEEAARLAREEEMSAKELIAAREAEWNARFERIEQERETERAIAERERQFLEVENYAASQRAANAEYILPELLDMVTGSTKEEVDRSVATLTQRTESILSNMSAAQQQQRMEGQRGPSVTAPPVGPSDNQSDYKSFTAQDIKNMPIAEYAKHRQGLLQSAGHQVTERGLYN